MAIRLIKQLTPMMFVLMIRQHPTPSRVHNLPRRQVRTRISNRLSTSMPLQMAAMAIMTMVVRMRHHERNDPSHRYR
jgi:hypothetical protein